MNITSRLIAPLAVLAALAAAPSIASAADFCVADQSCVDAGGADKPNVQTALNAAFSTPGVDRVLIGPGDFSTSGYYSYSTLSDGNAVQIIGAGRDRTRLLSTTTASGSYTLKLLGLSKSSVSDLAIEAPPAVPNATLHALELTGAATRVDITGHVGSGYGLITLDGAQALLDHAYVRHVSGGGDTAIEADSGTAAAITDSTIEDPDGTGLYADSGSAVRLSRVEFTGRRGVLSVGGDVRVDNSLFRIDSTLSTGLGATAGGSVTADHVTLVGPGAGIFGGVYAGSQSPGPATRVEIRNSIITGFAHSIQRYGVVGGPSDVTVTYSDFDRSTISQSGEGTLVADTGNVNVDPGFRDTANRDFRLAPESPLIDAGDPAGLAGGESETDLGGDPRLDGRSDIGAYELQRPAPQDAPSSPPATDQPAASPPAPVAAHISLAGRRRQHVSKRRALVVKLRTDQAVTVRARTSIRLKGVRRAIALKPLRTSRAAGSSNLRIKVGKRRARQLRRALGNGRRVSARVRVTARNDAGLTSTAARSVKLVR
jgi:hypothetical protein